MLRFVFPKVYLAFYYCFDFDFPTYIFWFVYYLFSLPNLISRFVSPYLYFPICSSNLHVSDWHVSNIFLPIFSDVRLFELTGSFLSFFLKNYISRCVFSDLYPPNCIFRLVYFDLYVPICSSQCGFHGLYFPDLYFPICRVWFLFPEFNFPYCMF